MSDILSKIVELRTENIKQNGFTMGVNIPSERLRPVHPFLQDKGVILEVKRASPSKGDIAPELDSYNTALSYAESGAGAISCLTEKNFFKGDLSDLMKVCAAVDEYERQTGKTGPAVLRKDFLITEEDIDVAFRAGADAVLLICRILSKEKIVSMARRAASCGMTSLVEVRLEEDVEKLKLVCGSVDPSYIVCGVNSRDLSDFTIDLLKPCFMLEKIKKVLGQNARVIFESGIRTPESAAFVSSLGFKGLLLGEAAAKNPSIRKELVQSFKTSLSDADARFWLNYSSSFGERTAKKLPLVKICGLTNSNDAHMAVKNGADFLGFIFYDKSPRHVNSDEAEKLLDELKEVKAVKAGVIVNPDDKEARVAIDLCKRGKLDVLQLHTFECAEKFISDKNLRVLPHYAAVNISSQEDVKKLDFLFDMGEPRVLADAAVKGIAVGGTGNCIDENLVKSVQKKYPLWIAGGLTPDNVRSVVSSFNPELIDCAGGVEEVPGKKSSIKLESFFSELK
ncbi:bifunctional indole-3-glycerol phosphate synthase/phosphoribosylanthranilate isomerase [Treponema sp.]|uniref:bifunctional indole-3-glycerol phosphate synthase/phosphoribosylanthranilate isomerase n=1 Tax=Treponema sp. TaxID=166 RepID=UPI00257C5A04|nr:bifunctional indole-3-glycerol phosphate synthase/phosphoribosylanthranilate isomerase [Treponema sp.]MBE6354345.1 bifunctional indole-3-glycerol phosphate synthase/phosphoribosylanthranilate isomerase [Treponema sp.]